VKYRVGNGRSGYRTDSAIPDSSLPFRVTEGEYEIIADHDVKNNILKGIRINGQDITGSFSLRDRRQRVSIGRFVIRASTDSLGSGINLQQFIGTIVLRISHRKMRVYQELKPDWIRL
jgi:hypothetical protein